MRMHKQNPAKRTLVNKGAPINRTRLFSSVRTKYRLTVILS